MLVNAPAGKGRGGEGSDRPVYTAQTEPSSGLTDRQAGGGRGQERLDRAESVGLHETEHESRQAVMAALWLPGMRVGVLESCCTDRTPISLCQRR